MHQDKAPNSFSKAIASRSVIRLRREGETEAIDDSLTVEEPLEIRVNGRRFTLTMRTPGHDELLARGLLFSEGLARDDDDFESVSLSTRCRDDGSELVNVVDVTLHELGDVPAHSWERSLISNSSCGLCGKASIEALSARVETLHDTTPIASDIIFSLPERMRARQSVFQLTGGLHAAAIFSAAGECRALHEDIGRHNATDKVIGQGLQQGWLPTGDDDETLVLLVSGRSSFEIVQKALVARIPIACSVSAASSLAVDLSQANNQTLVGFLRPNTMTIYCGSQRIVD